MLSTVLLLIALGDPKFQPASLAPPRLLQLLGLGLLERGKFVNGHAVTVRAQNQALVKGQPCVFFDTMVNMAVFLRGTGGDPSQALANYSDHAGTCDRGAAHPSLAGLESVKAD